METKCQECILEQAVAEGTVVGTESAEPKVLVQIVLHPNGSTSFAVGGDPSLAVTLMMQMILKICLPPPQKVIVPPTGVGGFRQLFKGNGHG